MSDEIIALCSFYADQYGMIFHTEIARYFHVMIYDVLAESATSLRKFCENEIG